MSRPDGQERQRLVERLFPQGVPALWCPLLTHYGASGAIDRDRMTAHLRHLAPWVKAYLIPGSTGDGWEMSDEEARQVLDWALDQAAWQGVQILVGVLKTDAGEARRSVRDTMAWLQTRTGAPDVEASLRAARVCGFAVCPPQGEHRSQEEISRSLASILELGAPTALYQLPQITRNEMGPELVSDLAARFPNFFLFKDSSGTDRVAAAGRAPEGVFRVRGAEGDYARWLAPAGAYYGLLLSTANCFARQFHALVQDLAGGRLAEAQALSARLSGVVGAVFDLVAGLPDGNPFANANKAMDHFFAHGPGAENIPPPRLRSGRSLPVEVLRAAGEALVRHGLMPARGYLDWQG